MDYINYRVNSPRTQLECRLSASGFYKVFLKLSLLQIRIIPIRSAILKQSLRTEVFELKTDSHWQQIHENQSELDAMFHSYWAQHSSFSTWQYWLMLGMFIVPLVVLYFAVDRRKIFELLFFGFAVHMLWAYTDIYLGEHNFMVHRYVLAPDMPFSVSAVASALPVSFILIYQYCTNRNKSYPLWMAVMSLAWAFGVASLEQMLGMLSFHNGMNHVILFAIDIAIGFIAYGLTLYVRKLARRPLAA